MIKPDIIPLPAMFATTFLITTLLFIADSHLEMHYIPADAEVGGALRYTSYTQAVRRLIRPPPLLEHRVPTSLTFEAAPCNPIYA